MEIIHLLFFPVLTLLLPLALQYFLTEDELFSYFKIYVLGAASGFITNALFLGINSFFTGRSHFSTILTKTVLVDGLLFVLVIVILFFGIVYKVIGSRIKLNLLNMSLFTVPVLLGYFSSLAIYQFSVMAIPNSPLVYTSILALIAIFSFFIGLGFDLILHSGSLILKIAVSVFLFLLLIVIASGYKLLFFFNFVLYSYFPILLCAVIFLGLFAILKLKGKI